MNEQDINKEFEKLGYKRLYDYEDDDEIIYYKDNHGECSCYDDQITFFTETSSFCKTDGSGVGYPNSFFTEQEQKLLFQLAEIYL